LVADASESCRAKGVRASLPGSLTSSTRRAMCAALSTLHPRVGSAKSIANRRSARQPSAMSRQAATARAAHWAWPHERHDSRLDYLRSRALLTTNRAFYRRGLPYPLELLRGLSAHRCVPTARSTCLGQGERRTQPVRFQSQTSRGGTTPYWFVPAKSVVTPRGGSCASENR
jgi:hypothetical protein